MGIKVGRLTAIRPWGTNRWGYKRWMFHCDCGNDKPIPVGHVGRNTSSCGHCGILVDDREDCKRDSIYNTLHNTWTNMRQRCNNPNNQDYHSYGSRGIKVCNEWEQSYSTFKKWAIENGWNPNLTQREQSIDRIDVNGNYEPDNCRWVDEITQARNKRNNVWVDFRGKKELLIKIGEEYNIPTKLIHQRYYRDNKRGEDLIAPLREIKKYEIHGEFLSVQEISEKYGVTTSAVTNRIFRKTLNKLKIKE